MTTVAGASRKLFWWTAVVAGLAALQFAARFSAEDPDPDALYDYVTAVAVIVTSAILLAVVLLVAGRDRELLALRRPRSWVRALGLAALVAFVILVTVGSLELLLRGGEEQGLTPEEWRPERAAQYAVNVLAVALVVPVVEELMYRGLGYSLLARFGQWPAIVLVGAAFAADHGLVRAFPALFVFGAALAWLRARTDSVYPGMLVHASWNGFTLVLAAAAA